MEQKKTRRSLQGVIVSDKMMKTVTVQINRRVKHPLIGKVVTKSKKYHVDTAGHEVSLGDTVTIEECAPISKSKAWRVSRVDNKVRVV